MGDQEEAQKIAINDVSQGRGPMPTSNLPQTVANDYNKAYEDAQRKQQEEAAKRNS